MKRGSSVRLTGDPRTSIAIACSPQSSGSDLGVGGLRRLGAGSHGPRRLADGAHDVVVARAAADVALKGVADLVVARFGVAGEKVGGDHDHARRAEPALEAVLLPERGLDRVELVVGLHPLDRRDLAAVRLDGEHCAGLDGPSVEMDRAGAALAGVATDVGAGQLEVLADQLDEEPSGLDVRLARLAVDRERDVRGHQETLLRFQSAGAESSGRPRCPTSSGDLRMLALRPAGIKAQSRAEWEVPRRRNRPKSNGAENHLRSRGFRRYRLPISEDRGGGM